MGILSKPKAPKETAEQVALANRTRSLLDDEISKEEKKFKSLARGKLGLVSLLSGSPVNPTQASRGSRGGGAGSLLDRGGSSSPSSPSSIPGTGNLGLRGL